MKFFAGHSVRENIGRYIFNWKLEPGKDLQQFNGFRRIQWFCYLTASVLN
jgi:hypothetical protein